LFHFSYLITHMAYLWSQRTPNDQIKYFKFDWSIYRLFVLKTTFKRDSLQMLFVNVWSTWSMVHIKDAFWYVNNKKWSKRCKFVSLFLFNNAYGLPMLTTDTNYPIKYFMFDWRNYRLFVLNTTFKRNSVQIMIFVNVCSK
jgi:hypothetical protein